MAFIEIAPRQAGRHVAGDVTLAIHRMGNRSTCWAIGLGASAMAAAELQHRQRIAVAYDPTQRRIRLTRTDGPGFTLRQVNQACKGGRVTITITPDRCLPHVTRAVALTDITYAPGRVEGTVPKDAGA